MRTTSELLAWYRPRRAMYPWRIRPDPYRTLVSEIMLQQTQAARVAPAFERFVRRFPSVRALAAAPRSEVLRAWDGLGYNRRAVWLSQAARIVVDRHGGRIPSDPSHLRALPGVGPYTADAVGAIAFGRAVPAVDVNVRRVVGRVMLGLAEAPEARAPDAARTWLGRSDPAAWNQAVMDLGREVCRPTPRCRVCPLSRACRFRGREGGRRRTTTAAERFEGSSRQARGAVVKALRLRSSVHVGGLVAGTGMDRARVVAAIAGLHRDGVVTAGPAALAGRPGGRVRLSDG